MLCRTLGTRFFVVPHLVLVATVAFSAVSATEVFGQEKIVRIEEDWEMVVADANPGKESPQVTSVMSPLADLSSYHMAFEINHQSMPSFSSGGLQLQLWNGDSYIRSQKFPTAAAMASANEAVTWTQTMEVSGGQLTFEVISGSSSSFNGFGGQGYLKTIIGSPIQNLNSYSPDVSVANSGVGFGGNRVSSMTLKRVRVYTSTGTMYEDTTDRVAHSFE